MIDCRHTRRGLRQSRVIANATDRDLQRRKAISKDDKLGLMLTILVFEHDAGPLSHTLLNEVHEA